MDYKTTQAGNTKDRGLYVAAVSYNDDFHVGDRIIGVNGTMVASGSEIRDVIKGCREGDVVNITLLREGERMEVRVALTRADVPVNDAGYVA